MLYFHWIALNALYGQHHERRGKEIGDIDQFLHRICELDQEDGRLSQILCDIKPKTDRLLKDQFLSETYWKEGLSIHFKREREKDINEAQTAYKEGKLGGYFIILFRRLRVLRNQIFHGCSTDRDSLNKNSLQPALEILKELVPQFLKIFRERGSGCSWGKISYPRKGSPQHPK